MGVDVSPFALLDVFDPLPLPADEIVSSKMLRALNASLPDDDADLAHFLEYGEYDRLTPAQLAAEVQSRGIDPSTARPGCSDIQLLLRDDQDGKRAAIGHNKSVDLFSLPAEIRLMIYEYANEESAPQSMKPYGICEAVPIKEPAMLQVCNFMRRETIPVFYRKQEFSFRTPENGSFYRSKDEQLMQLERWLSKMGKERLDCAGSIHVRLPIHHQILEIC